MCKGWILRDEWSFNEHISECWRKSSRGCDHRMARELGPGNQRFLNHSIVLLRTPGWFQRLLTHSIVLQEAPGLFTRRQSIKASTQFWRMGAEIYSFCSSHDQPHGKFPCWLKLPSPSVEWPASFSSPVCLCSTLCMGASLGTKAGITFLVRGTPLTLG